VLVCPAAVVAPEDSSRFPGVDPVLIIHTYELGARSIGIILGAAIASWSYIYFITLLILLLQLPKTDPGLPALL